MAEEKKKIPRGVVVEFDFAVVDGAQLLFDTAKKVLARYFSTLDKAVKQGVIKRNTADRRKSRAAKRIAKIAK